MAKVTGLRTWRNGETINARDYVYERNVITTAINTNDDILALKVDEANVIYVDTQLPADLTTLDPQTNLGIYNTRWFLIRETTGVGHLYYISNTTAIEVELKVGQVNLAITGIPEDALGEGEMRYNDTTGSFDFGLKGGHILSVGGVLVKRVRNDNGTDLKVGQVVYVSGAVGNSGLLKVKKASNVGESTSSKTFGIVVTTMSNGQDGYVYLYGLLQGINLNDNTINDAASPLQQADVGGSVFLGEDGKLRKGIPTGDTQHSVFVGYLETWGGNGNNASIYVKIQNGYEIDELHDVRISNKQDGEVLVYDSTRSIWKNSNRLSTAESDIDTLQSDVNTAESDITSLEGRMDTAETDIDNVEQDLSTHEARQDNPHNVTKTQVGLSDVNNTSDLNKPISTATQTALDLKADLVEGKVPASQLPSYVDDVLEVYERAGTTPTNSDWFSLTSGGAALTPEIGKIYVVIAGTLINKTYRWGGTHYSIIGEMALGTTAATAFFGDRGLATETQSNNIVSGVQGLTDTRITNSVAGVVPLIVNGVVSTTEDLQRWNVNNSTLLYVASNGVLRSSTGLANNAVFNNAYVNVASTGVVIQRNIADANHSLIVNLANAGSTGDILRLQFAGANKLEITKDGFINQNGTRFITNPTTNSTFVGLLSGGTSTTGTENTAFGRASLNSLTSGGQNSVVGQSAGRTLTTGGGNTFVGDEAGFNASQLATASNSTGIGRQAFTDKSNQMVFGNASVTEFKFDRNTGALALLPQTQISSATFPPLSAERTTTVTNAGLVSVRLLATTSGDMVDGFGVVKHFSIRDNANVINTIADIGASRSGADNSGKLYFSTNNAGTITEKMTILPDGKVGIGTASPARLLSLLTASNADGLQIRRNSNAPSDYANLGFRISTTEFADANAEVRAVRTNRAVNQDTDLRFTTLSNGTLAERMTIRDDGNVGIGTSSPTSKLEVVGSAFPVISAERTSTGTNTYAGSIRTLNTTTADMIDGFGTLLNFSIRDNANVINPIVNIGAQRSGADNSGRFVVSTFTTGTETERMTILPSGNVGIGTSAPVSVFHANASITLSLPATSGTTQSGHIARLGATNQTGNVLDIGTLGGTTGGYWLQSTVATDLSLTSPLRLNPNGGNVLIGTGLVGINETSFTTNVAQLVVKSGATNRVPLIVDTLASHTEDLQVWRLNGANRTKIDANGQIATTGIYNTTASANSYLLLETTGTTIRRNVADTNPALIVNLVNASATGNIQVWQKAGTALLAVGNDGTLVNGTSPNFGSNSSLKLSDNGSVISRNISDANVALIVNQVHASSTGNITQFQWQGTTQASIARDGIANFTGTPSNEQTGNYTLVLADKGKVLRVNSSSNRTITIPKNSAVAFPVDTEIAILRYGSGTVSIAPVDGDVTLQSADGERKIKNRYGSVALKKIGTDEWVLVGSLEA